VLLLFDRRKFRPWWFETGTPRFLLDLLTERETWLPRLGQLETDAALLSAFEVGNISTEALMFHTYQDGYRESSRPSTPSTCFLPDRLLQQPHVKRASARRPFK
jgi:hypothetical protein